jgi:uncharacterized protein (DUF433 family)/predicted nuclease of predicted toxin-antitoxin system
VTLRMGRPCLPPSPRSVTVKVMPFDRITFDPLLMGRRASIRGMRITVAQVVNLVANGMAVEEIIREYPELEADDVAAGASVRSLTRERGDPPARPHRRVKLLADVGVSMTTVEALRSRGHDVKHLRDEGLHKLPDAQILDQARSESRAIIAFDLDFADLLAAGGQNGPSVVILRLADQTPASVNPRLVAALTQCEAELAATGGPARLVRIAG